MPRKTHPERGNTRVKAEPTTDNRKHTTEALAESLVERGLASPLILDPRRYAMESRPGGLSHGR